MSNPQPVSSSLVTDTIASFTTDQVAVLTSVNTEAIQLTDKISVAPAQTLTTMFSWTGDEIDSHLSEWLRYMTDNRPDFKNIHPITWIELELNKLADKLKGL